MAEYELITEGGYPLDECMSALQKEIRRGHEKEALYWAIELNSKFPNVCWKRLVTIVTEDIGAANPQLVNTVANLYQVVMNLRKESKTHDYDLCILSYAVLAMARSPKSREADDAVNEVLRDRRIGEFVLEVPDYAIDKHTSRGKKLGRDVRFFWSEGAKLSNEAYPSKYKGWDDQYGDGYYDQTGKRANFKPGKRSSNPQTTLFDKEPLFAPAGDEQLGDDDRCKECNRRISYGHTISCSRYGEED